MKVTARLHATLRRATPNGLQNRVSVELPENATIADLLAALAIDASPEHVMLLIDHRRVTPAQPLADGDEVQLFPPISGG
ncbi:MAG: hypothetical protein Kow0031_17210 [Anaerolineae bacterium]